MSGLISENGVWAIRVVVTLQWELCGCLSVAFGERTCLCVAIWGPHSQVLFVQLTPQLPLVIGSVVLACEVWSQAWCTIDRRTFWPLHIPTHHNVSCPH